MMHVGLVRICCKGTGYYHLHWQPVYASYHDIAVRSVCVRAGCKARNRVNFSIQSE